MMQDEREDAMGHAVPQSEDTEMGILDRMYDIEGLGKWLLHGDIVHETGEKESSLDMNELCIESGPGSVSDMFKKLREQVGAMFDVHEAYSPPRANDVAANMRTVPELSMGLTTSDTDGRPWDFNDVEMRTRAWRNITTEKCILLVLCPMCSAHSAMNRGNYSKMTEKPVRDKIQYANRHLEFTMLLARQQHKQGLHFLFEHPKAATSWQHPLVRHVQSLEGVITVESDICAHDMVINHQGESLYAKKPTRFLTHSPCIAQRLRKYCLGDHARINLYKAGKARLTQVYPRHSAGISSRD